MSSHLLQWVADIRISMEFAKFFAALSAIREESFMSKRCADCENIGNQIATIRQSGRACRHRRAMLARAATRCGSYNAGAARGNIRSVRKYDMWLTPLSPLSMADNSARYIHAQRVRRPSKHRRGRLCYCMFKALESICRDKERFNK